MVDPEVLDELLGDLNAANDEQIAIEHGARRVGPRSRLRTTGRELGPLVGLYEAHVEYGPRSATRARSQTRESGCARAHDTRIEREQRVPVLVAIVAAKGQELARTKATEAWTRACREREAAWSILFAPTRGDATLCSR